MTVLKCDNEMKIREATIKDCSAIQALSAQLGYEYPVNKVEKQLNSILGNDDHKVFLAISPESDDVIGYIHVQRYRILYFDDFLNILGFVVDESWRKKGIGSKLIRKAEEIAVYFHCKGVRASSQTKCLDAHQFYKKQGFENYKEQKCFIKFFDGMQDSEF